MSETRGTVMQFVSHCCGMAGAVGTQSSYVTAKEWRDFCSKNSDIYFSWGRLFRVHAEDSAGGMVRIYTRWA